MSLTSTTPPNITIDETKDSPKRDRTPSPLRKSKVSPSEDDNKLLLQRKKSSPLLGFRACNFTNSYRSKRRRTSIAAWCSENKMSSITHSTRMTFLDFVDLFKSFGLRCRRDLKDLFEQFATTVKPFSKDTTDKQVPYQDNVTQENDTCRYFRTSYKIVYNVVKVVSYLFYCIYFFEFPI